MEIFTKEFKNELSKQLNEITFESKKENKIVMSESEIVKAMESCFNTNPKMESCFNTNPNKEEKKKSKGFKLGDIVYLELLLGEIVFLDKKRDLIVVEFINGVNKDFRIDGSVCDDSPKLLYHYPYELKIKKLKH